MTEKGVLRGLLFKDIVWATIFPLLNFSLNVICINQRLIGAHVRVS